MAKKGVVIFDGEDMFINPKKAIYSKTRGEARNASFMSARGDDGPEEPEGPMGRERIVREEVTGGGGGVSEAALPTTSTPIAAPIIDEPKPTVVSPIINEPQPTIIGEAESLSKQKGVEPDTPITVTLPKAEVPTIVVPPILPPDYIAPTPELPKRPTPPQRPGSGLDDDFIAKRPGDDGSGGRYSGPDNNPGLNQTPIYTIDDGSPQKPIIDTPRYVAPVPVLPTAPTPPAAIVIPDPMGGGGSPLLDKDPEIPKINCPDGFTLSPATGRCIPIIKDDEYVGPGSNAPGTPRVDPCAFPPTIPLVANHEWKKTGDCTWEQIPKSTSTTDTITTKAADKVEETSTTTTTTTKKPDDKVAETTTSSTTTTTTKKSKNCNPPIYAPPKYYKWVDKGNCTFELAVDTTQVPNPSPAPVLPAVNGQPIININLPTGGLGTVPTTPTTAPTVELPVSDSGGASGGGGGGGTPFPEEPAPVVEEAPKKNYFWWYVGGALAVYLLIKRKKSQ